MKKFSVALLAGSALSIALASGSANAQILYQATTNDSGNGLNFGPDGTANPPTGAGYWEMGNTITLAGSSSGYFLGSVDLTLYGGGDPSYPIQMDIYSGSDPNTGTHLGTYTAPAGYGTNTTVFNIGGLYVPTDTITYILSLPDQNGSYDSIFLYPILTSGAAPTVGSGPNSLWYGTPGSFVANSTYAHADGNAHTTNYLQVEVIAAEGGGALLYLLLGGGACFGAMFFISRNRLAKLTAA